MKKITPHSSLHEYDKNWLEGERVTLHEVKNLLLNTQVPDSIHGGIKEQISDVELTLEYGHDHRITE